MLHTSSPTLCLYAIVACFIASGSTSLEQCIVAQAVSGSPDGDNNMLSSQHTITASISRRLAFPDFKDDEKVGAITLLGSAGIDKHSGTINIPATPKSTPSNVHNASMSMSPMPSPHLSSNIVQPAPSNWSKMAGRALYSFPFRMMDPISNTTASFHTSFSFRMQKAAEMEGNFTTNSSDGGLTFLVVPDELTVGRNGGWLGMMNDACDDNYKPFAIEFDTFKNEEFQDPNDHHVGINYGSIVSHQTADIADAGVSLREGDTVQAWVSYDSYKHLVDVRLAKEGNKKPVEPLLSVPLDLSTIFKEYMFVGFSGGASGSFRHSILSWHFSSDSTGILRIPKQESCADRLLPPHHSQSHKAPSAFIIFCLVVLILALAFFNFACIPYKKKGDEMPTAVKLMRLARAKPRALLKPRKFSLHEVLEASRFFNEGEILGSGPSGTYYRGVLQDSSQVAIKRFSSSYLRQVSQMSSDRRKIEKEINRLAQVHHPNIVPLRGWCIEKEEALLIYEYMPNGSLDQWLFSQASTLPWIRRYKIVKELAGALVFLHSNLEKPVVHKNLKLSNVLLDITFRAKLGDYGLFHRVSPMNSMEYSTKSKFGLRKYVTSPGRTLAWHPMHECMCLPGNGSPSLKSKNRAKFLDHVSNGNTKNEWVGSLRRDISTHMMKGCILPAMMSENLKITEENDVYSYGVMLFEIVCGRMQEEEGAEDLVEWVWSLQEEGKLAEAIDEDLRIGARYYTWEEEAACVLTIGLLCTLHDPYVRPSMEMVTKYLHGEIPIPKVPSSRRLVMSSSLSSLTNTMDEPDAGDSVVTYPDPRDDYTRSPPSKIFHVGCSPMEFYCLKTSSHVVAP